MKEETSALQNTPDSSNIRDINLRPQNYKTQDNNNIQDTNLRPKHYKTHNTHKFDCNIRHISLRVFCLNFCKRIFVYLRNNHKK